MRRRFDDCGQIGGIEAVVFGVLVFVLGVLAVANAWGVVDAKLAASAAAREATRAFVESPHASTEAAFADAVRAAEEAITAHGRSLDRFSLPRPPGLTLERCAPATFEARYRVPLVGRFGSSFEVSSRHTEVVDPYRSGVPGGAAACR